MRTHREDGGTLSGAIMMMLEGGSAAAWLGVPLALLLGVAVDRFAVPALLRVSQRRGLRVSQAVLSALAGGAVVVLTVLPAIATLVAALALPGRVEARVDDALAIAAIFTVAVVVARLAAAAMREVARRTVLPAATLFTSTARVAVYTIAGLVALQTAGVPVGPVLATLGVGGLAVALALKDTLSNLFAGLQIIASRQVRPGDAIRVDAIEGVVVDVTWRNTSVRDLTGAIVVVPNEKLAQAVLTNYSLREREVTVDVRLGVAYESDLEKVERLALEEADASGGAGLTAAAFRIVKLGEARVEIAVILSVAATADPFVARHEFLKRLHARYRRDNVAMVAYAAPPPPVPLRKASGGTRTLYDG